MRVILFRHGIAHDRADPECPPDPERALTAEGEKKTRKAARGLRELGCAPTRILTSPYRRARETAGLVAAAFDLDEAQVTLTEALVPEAPPHALFQQLFAFNNADEEIVCVGHAPNLDKVIAVALTGERAPVTALKKAGAALLLLEDLPRMKGDLVWLLPPKVLGDLG
ncbi:MAG: phosphohistidine phosphatase SixA [Deltaproteobacteria bacterium RBG_16_71_12]|nr:MAG: phosphohistidine phosphatase SixA [Deltaproteobacteria bacterium RBG_16_71_12]